MSDTMKIVWADTSRRDRQSTAAKKAYAADPTIVKRLSATRQGIPYEEWTGFVSNGEYCEKFNEACKEVLYAINHKTKTLLRMEKFGNCLFITWTETKIRDAME